MDKIKDDKKNNNDRSFDYIIISIVILTFYAIAIMIIISTKTNLLSLSYSAISQSTTCHSINSEQ